MSLRCQQSGARPIFGKKAPRERAGQAPQAGGKFRLGRLDSNQDNQLQRLTCCHCTTPQSGPNCITGRAVGQSLPRQAARLLRFILWRQAELFGLVIREHVRFGWGFLLVRGFIPKFIQFGRINFFPALLEQRRHFPQALLNRFHWRCERLLMRRNAGRNFTQHWFNGPCAQTRKYRSVFSTSSSSANPSPMTSIAYVIPTGAKIKSY